MTTNYQPINQPTYYCVQFGCGLSAPEQWLNFDASPTLRLQRLPLIGKLMPAGPFGRFPANVQYGDVVKGLPIAPESVDLLYCSHVLEHLALNELRLALHNCFTYLKPGGIFRLVLPDLECLVRQYLESGDPEAASTFMRESYLGKENRHRSLISFIKEWLGGSEHLWMWDHKSLSLELEKVGFKSIKRVKFGDSGIAPFAQVEDPDRWVLELGIECEK